MEECTRWIVGRGNIKFWMDNWLGEKLIGPLPCDMFTTAATALDQIADFLPLIPLELLDKIKRIHLAPHAPDKIIFTLTQTGVFLTKEYYEHLRSRGRREAWPDKIWHKYIPPKTSGFMWKLLHHALPVDLRVISRGIPLVSRCVCYKMPQQEDVQHLFFRSEVAKVVWNRFRAMFKLPSNWTSAKHALSIWVPKPKASSFYAMIRTSVVVHIMREIWIARCKVVCEGGDMAADNISRRVFYNIQNLGISHTPKQPSTKHQIAQLEAAGLLVLHPTIKRGTWHKWEVPIAGGYKLNTDGSSKDGRCMGGGIIRDSGGNIIAGFSTFFGDGTNNAAEILAVWQGLRLCKTLGIGMITVETDSSLIINDIHTDRNCSMGVDLRI